MNDADEESPAARLAALPAGTLVVLSDSAGLLSAEPPAYALRPIPPLPPGAAPRALPRSLPPGSLFVVLRCGDFLGFKSLSCGRTLQASGRGGALSLRNQNFGSFEQWRPDAVRGLVNRRWGTQLPCGVSLVRAVASNELRRLAADVASSLSASQADAKRHEASARAAASAASRSEAAAAAAVERAAAAAARASASEAARSDAAAAAHRAQHAATTAEAALAATSAALRAERAAAAAAAARATSDLETLHTALEMAAAAAAAAASTSSSSAAPSAYGPTPTGQGHDPIPPTPLFEPTPAAAKPPHPPPHRAPAAAPPAAAPSSHRYAHDATPPAPRGFSRAPQQPAAAPPPSFSSVDWAASPATLPLLRLAAASMLGVAPSGRAMAAAVATAAAGAAAARSAASSPRVATPVDVTALVVPQSPLEKSPRQSEEGGWNSEDFDANEPSAADESYEFSPAPPLACIALPLAQDAPPVPTPSPSPSPSPPLPPPPPPPPAQQHQQQQRQHQPDANAIRKRLDMSAAAGARDQPAAAAAASAAHLPPRAPPPRAPPRAAFAPSNARVNVASLDIFASSSSFCESNAAGAVIASKRAGDDGDLFLGLWDLPRGGATPGPPRAAARTAAPRVANWAHPQRSAGEEQL